MCKKMQTHKYITYFLKLEKYFVYMGSHDQTSLKLFPKQMCEKGITFVSGIR